MVDLHEDVFDEVASRRRKLLPREFVGLVERHHADDGAGVSRDVLEAYVTALDDELDGQFDAESFLESLESGVADAETWQGSDALYALGDDRVSRYPATWHDALGGSADVREYVAYLLDEPDGYPDDLDSGAAGRGVPENELLDVVSVVGRIDRETAKQRLEERRSAGDLVEDADQHPEARVRLAE